MSFDPSRLFTILNNTGLQIKDPPLYQFLKSLITTLSNLNTQTNAISSGGSSVVITNQQILQGLIDGLDGEDGAVIPGPRGLVGDRGLSIQGLDGLDGEDAPIIPGPQGIQGVQGNTGSNGAIGIPGQDGADGE